MSIRSLNNMLSGYPPFSDDYGDIPLIDQIKKARFSFTDESWRSVSKDAKNLISKLIVTNANKRLSSAQALNHSWLKDTEMKKTVEDLIRKDEEKHRSAASDNPLSQVEQENEANVDGDGDGVESESESESVSSVATLSLKKTDSLKENSNEISAVDPSQIDADVPPCAKKTKVDV